MVQAISTFDSTKEPLGDLLRSIHQGHIQLPDFQRGWVWDDHHIVSLIGSLAQTYPIGAIMVLQTGNPDVKFKTRTVEGAPAEATPVEAERLILDGQQRLTSLYQSLYSRNPVLTRDTRGWEMKRWYYLDMRKALEPGADLEEAVVSLPESRQLKNFRGEVQHDYSTPEAEWEHELFPLNLVFDSVATMQWQFTYQQYIGQQQLPDGPARLGRWMKFYQQVLLAIQQYNLPVIKLGKESPKAAICQVFEKVNTGGVSLTVFELITATFAIDDFDLRKDWKTRAAALKHYPVLAQVPSDNFLQAVSLIASYALRQQKQQAGTPAEELPPATCKRKDLLRLPIADYKAWADKTEQGFVEAAKFLHTQHIFTHRDLPYASQLVPLAALLTLLGPGGLDHGATRARLGRWFWSGVLGELYGSATETRFARDVQEVVPWLQTGSDEPATVREANFYPARLRSLRSRGSAAYKGLYALMMQRGAVDFGTGVGINAITYFDEGVDIHHIFPKKWCVEQGLPAAVFDSIINKTPLAYRTNRKIGGHAPSHYLKKLRDESGLSEADQAGRLTTHLLAADLLAADDFAACYNQRAREILALISQAMGKPVTLEAGKEILDI